MLVILVQVTWLPFPAQGHCAADGVRNVRTGVVLRHGDVSELDGVGGSELLQQHAVNVNALALLSVSRRETRAEIAR